MIQNIEEPISINCNHSNEEEFDPFGEPSSLQEESELFDFYVKPNNEKNYQYSFNSKQEDHCSISNEFFSNENEKKFKNFNNFDSSESFNKELTNEEEKHICNVSQKIKKKRNKWENFSFHVPEYIKLLDPKSQRKEIQKLKNRISAQISRDKKKQEFEVIQNLNFQLEQENKKLLSEISFVQNENALLLKKLNEYKCNRCGFCNSDIETLSESNDNLSQNNVQNSPIRINNLSRTSSYSLFLGTLTILGAITLFCIAVPFYSNNTEMRNTNLFAQINQTQNPQYEWKMSKENTIKLLHNKLACELIANETTNTSQKNSTAYSSKEKFLAKKNNYPIVPWNYFLDKITTVFCPHASIYRNNTFESKNELENPNLITIKGEWLHLLIPKLNNTPEALYITVDDSFKDYKQYLEVWAKIYGMRDLTDKI